MRLGPIVATLLALVACGRDGDGTPAPSPHTAPAPAASPSHSSAAAAPADPGRQGTPTVAGASAPKPAPGADAGPWISWTGTSIVGMGILRVVPAPGGPATFRIRYHEFPDGYATKGNLQLFVLPGDAFATDDRAHAGDFLAFARTADEQTTDDDGALRLEVSFTAESERTLLVGYGPWTAPDAGRPAGDVPTFSLTVTSDRGEHEWLESEAGEFITTNFSLRREVARGKPFRDPLAAPGAPNADLYIEIRPMILYDARLVRASNEAPDAPAGPSPAALRAEADAHEKAGRAAIAADRRERAADLEAAAARADRRIVMTPTLAEKFRRVPIRWR